MEVLNKRRGEEWGERRKRKIKKEVKVLNKREGRERRKRNIRKKADGRNWGMKGGREST